MQHLRFVRATAVALLAGILICGCGNRRESPGSEELYASIEREFVDLYGDLHPLSASRRGLYGSDSLLFTFSEEEIEMAVRRLRALLGDVDDLPLTGLAQAKIDNTAILLNWLKGELFALETVCHYRSNPMLYCWMAEEALFGMSSRIVPPYRGEREAYETRLDRLGDLLANARSIIQNPARLHVNMSIERLDRILGDMETLEELAAARYGSPVSALETARGSIERFRRHLDREVSNRAFGRIILGTENLSKIIIYDELMDIDVNKTIEEAEKMIRKLDSQLRSVEKNLDISLAPSGAPGIRTVTGDGNAASAPVGKTGKPLPGNGPRWNEPLPGGGDLDSLALELARTIDARSYERKLADKAYVPEMAILRRQSPARLAELPADPYLTIPSPYGATAVVTATPPFSGLDHLVSILIDEEHIGDRAGLFYCLLRVAAPVRSIYTYRRENHDSVRTLLRSRSFRECWTLHNLEDLVEVFPDWKLPLQRLLIKEKIYALARMIVVFRLHAGTYTSEAAALYLARTASITPRQAEDDVARASYSPSILYTGIGIVMCDEMVKKAAFEKGVRNPRMRVRSLMLEHVDLPIVFLRSRLPVRK